MRGACEQKDNQQSLPAENDAKRIEHEMNLLNIGVVGELADLLFASRYGEDVSKPKILSNLLGFPVTVSCSFGLAVTVLISDQDIQLIIVVTGSEIRDNRWRRVHLQSQWTTLSDLTWSSSIVGIADNSYTTAVTVAVTIVTITVSSITVAVLAIAIAVCEASLVLLGTICVVEAGIGVPKEGEKE
jgi:hypothetical protein